MTSTAAKLPLDHPFASPSKLHLRAPDFTRIKDEHFLPAILAGMAAQVAEVRAIADSEDRPTFENTVEALERSGELLGRTMRVFSNLSSAHTNPALQAVQKETAPLLAAHQDGIWLDARLFSRVEAVHAERAQLASPEAQRLVERYHTSFVRHGVRLEADAQARLRAINSELSQLATAFQDQLLADTNARAVFVETREELAGLSEGAISAAAAAAKEAGREGGYLLTLQLPSSQGVLASLSHRPTRQRVFEAANARCRSGANDTADIVRSQVALRAERAALLGFETHAHYVLADEMAGTPQAVRGLLESLAPRIAERCNAEQRELEAWLTRHAPDQKLEPWDWSFVAEQVRAELHDLDDATVRPYFPLERVLEDGVFHMARELYGVTMHERHDLPVYHPDVRVWDVLDEDGSLVGLFYGDYYARPSKRGGAWMNTFVDQSALLGELPVVVNVMNIPKPSGGRAALLSFDEVTTMFHEFGHAVHGLFSRVEHPMLSGTSVPRDFVEFPSQFHEDFAFDPRILERCARHHETGEPLPYQLATRIRATRTFGQGFGSLEYIASALLDIAWHSVPAGTKITDVQAFEDEALRRAGVANPLVPPRYRSHYFAHIFQGGYSAGYYAYLWSEALAADGFASVMQDGGMNRTNGQRIRDTVLSRGLTADPMTMYRTFRGRELDPQALLVRRGLAEAAGAR